MAMTSPIEFIDESGDTGFDPSVAITDPTQATPGLAEPYPAAMIPRITQERKDAFINWLELNITEMEGAFADKHNEWAAQEDAYRAKPGPVKTFPFDGACNDVIPLMAMGVDPVHARLDVGIFKSTPVFTLKALKKSYVDLMPSVNTFIEYYQKHKLNLRRIVSPRLLEMTKHGDMVLKTVYDREKYKVQTYNENWEVIEKEVIRFSGPRVFGVPIDRFYYLPGYQDIQACPLAGEKQKVTFDWLKIQEASGKLIDVDMIKGQVTNEKTSLEEELERSANHKELVRDDRYYDVWELWADFDINEDGLPERLVCTYHVPTRTIMQLRYNWYFHQRKPYTVVPYTVTNNSLHGLGIGEMTMVFQNAATQWHQMATDNAYLANIRMFITSKDSDIEDRPRLYGGRVFKVNDPQKDLIPFRMGDTYNSTLQERQNIFGLAEKRNGISDYLTGRESPIVGSRATATSTLALIDEGTKRVEQTMENIRIGLAEVIENCIYIWMQYGLDDIDQVVFGDDQVAKDVTQFFNDLTAANVNGAIAVDLTATDAKSNRIARQQVQMAIIQVMMTFYEKFVQLGTQAIQAQQSMPAVAGLMQDVAESARKLFKELLVQYEVPDPDSYIPELEKYFDAAAIAAGALGQGGAPGPDPNAGGQPGVPTLPPGGGGVQAGGDQSIGLPRLPQPGIPGAGPGPGM